MPRNATEEMPAGNADADASYHDTHATYSEYRVFWYWFM